MCTKGLLSRYRTEVIVLKIKPKLKPKPKPKTKPKPTPKPKTGGSGPRDKVRIEQDGAGCAVMHVMHASNTSYAEV